MRMTRLLKNSSPIKIGILFAILSGISVLVYIAFGCITYRCGYPLDDAWIHQTYARNLIEYKEWSFIPGQPSAGSTSPLWTMMISTGYGLRIDPMVWTFFLGFVFLFFLSMLFLRIYRVQFPDLPDLAIWGGLLVIFEWHFVWSAASGMETLLCTLLYSFVILLLPRILRSWLLAGVMVGFCCWVRPDAITLFLPLSIVIFTDADNWTSRFFKLFQLITGMVVAIAPYLLFNYLIGDTWLPSTFIAKQAEYAEMTLVPLVERLARQASLPMIGLGALLFPGFCYNLVTMVRKKDWHALSGVIWMLLFIMLYALRLPVTYQHGRYLIPVFPIYFFWGFVGVHNLNQWLGRYWKGILNRTWNYSMAVVLFCFWIIGGFIPFFWIHFDFTL